MNRKIEIFKNDSDILKLGKLPVGKVFLEIPEQYIDRETGEINLQELCLELDSYNGEDLVLEYDVE